MLACTFVLVGARTSERARVALLTQHAKRMHHVMLSSVASQAALYFSSLSHKRHNFRKTFTEYKTSILIFSTNFI
jgi:3-methyladenine DNA glycosylase Tag